MKAFRLFNLTELSPASPLYFLERSGAEGYRSYVRWPYGHTGRWPLQSGGSIPLTELDLRTEEVDLPAVRVPELEMILLVRDSIIGCCYLLPGDCFNPDQWEHLSATDLSDPHNGPLLHDAQKKLRLDQHLAEQAPDKDLRWGH
jgi:hypothetical protein